MYCNLKYYKSITLDCFTGTEYKNLRENANSRVLRHFTKIEKYKEKEKVYFEHLM